MPEMAARPLHLCLPLQKIPREARLLQEAHRKKGIFASDIRVCVLTKIQCLIAFSY